MEERNPSTTAIPAITAACYLLAGFTWIWLSDEAGRKVFASVDDFARFQQSKGSIFMLVTALALYLWLGASCRSVHRRELRQREDARRELERRTEELLAANRALESFTYSVAHDLRAPVAHVDGFAKALQDTIRDRDPQRASHYTQRIVANARLMSEMIEGLLHVSRAERAVVQHEHVDMAALVQDVLAELAPDPKVAIAVDALPGAHADRALLRQVWTNLISNAVKYSAKAEGPRVCVSGEQVPGEIVYCVQDNGVGFDTAESDRLFNAFQRLSNAQAFAGSGVGLAIIKRIVERHGGRAWASGAPGQGARFCFSLPAAH